MKKIQFGCGGNLLDGWDNFDIEMDIAEALRFEDNSVDYILAEHVVEHVNHNEALCFFDECRRILKEGGVLRVCIPSFQKIKDLADSEYVEFTKQFFANSKSPDVHLRAIVLCHEHKSMWTSDVLWDFLSMAGFDKIKKCDMRKSDHEARRDVDGHWKVIGEKFANIETEICEAIK